jgi:general secretion pathway protein H
MARTPTSAPGSSLRARAAARSARGFTLLELLIVVALMAVASSVAVLALRDPTEGQLDREAMRLAALLESARTESRVNGYPVLWRPALDRSEADFIFAGRDPQAEALPTRWLDERVQAFPADPRGLLLGPEPFIGTQRLTLQLEHRRVVLATDGVGPFAIAARESDTP